MCICAYIVNLKLRTFKGSIVCSVVYNQIYRIPPSSGITANSDSFCFMAATCLWVEYLPSTLNIRL